MQVSIAVVVKSCSLGKSSMSNTFLNYAEYKQACRLLFTIQVQSNIHALIVLQRFKYRPDVKMCAVNET